MAKIASRRAWIVFVFVYVCYLANMADRYILSILAEAIKRDLTLTDAEIGLLTGPAIALLYAFFGVPLGHLADRVNRTRFLAASLAIWSLCTALGSLAANAWQLALSRIGVSAAEGGGIPASVSLLADYFPPARRALILSIFASASTTGIFVSFGLGGYISHHYGWRIALIAAGAPGLLLSTMLLIFVAEPVRGVLDDPLSPPKMDSRSLWRSIATILAIPIYRRVLVANGALSFAIAVTLSWAPTFVIRKFGSEAATVGASLGLGIALIGGVCMIVAGIVVDRMGSAGLSRALNVVAILQGTAVILLGAALSVGNLIASVALFSLLYGVMHFYVPAFYAVANNHVPPALRATAIAVGVLAMTVVGNGLAPPIVGLLSDALSKRFGADALAFAMMPASIFILVASVQYHRAANVLKTTLSVPPS